jgi:hypothetical protein
MYGNPRKEVRLMRLRISRPFLVGQMNVSLFSNLIVKVWEGFILKINCQKPKSLGMHIFKMFH